MPEELLKFLLQTIDIGVKAGMFVRDAKARCPHLVIVPYNFEAYEKVADQFYNILHKHCDKVQAVSCDEAFLDVTDSDVTDPELLVSEIRREILETTGCTASAGIAANMLMARIATRIAKPDGQCYIPVEKVDEYLLQLPIKSLPGIGHVLEQKLKSRGVQTCSQLRMFSKEALQRDFGTKTGEMLWNYCRGIDNRPVGVIQAGCFKNMGKQSLPAFGAATPIISDSVAEPEILDLMPTSLSQVDMSILQQLPEELRADVVGALPAHRSSNCLPESSGNSGGAQEVRAAEDST